MQQHRVQDTRLSKKTYMDRIEQLGDTLPHPFYIFVFLCLVVLILSALYAGQTVTHPGTLQDIAVQNLLSDKGLVYILESAINNFTGFKPLGLVLCMMMAVGLLQETGLADAAIKGALLNAPRRFITASIFIVGIIGNLASDAAFILVPPLAGIIFAATQRNPVVGIAAGFVAVAAGFTANIFVAGTDVLLSSITTEATAVIAQTTISPAANWYFMLLSVPFLVILGTFITEYIVEPRVNLRYPIQSMNGSQENVQDFKINPQQKRALKVTALAALGYIVLISILIYPDHSPLRNQQGGLAPSPFLNGIIPIIMFFFMTCATIFGIMNKVIKKADDFHLLMAKSLKTVGGYIVLVFVIAQFIEWFKWSNLAIYMAVQSANWLSHLSLPIIAMLGMLIILTGLLNLIVFSGSAQWAMMAPIFIPLFMLLGISPEVTQMAYRIGDSTTNIISPTNPYIPMILALMTKYQPRIRFGALMSMMLPYLFSFITLWSILFLIYIQLDLPLGPINLS